MPHWNRKSTSEKDKYHENFRVPNLIFFETYLRVFEDEVINSKCNKSKYVGSRQQLIQVQKFAQPDVYVQLKFRVTKMNVD